VAAGFLRSGDWLVPRLYGEPLLTKPPLAYAAIAAASWPLGRVTETTARLPSAVAATAVLFLIYVCFRRHFGRAGGLTAAALLPCSPMWLLQAPSAEIDMQELAWVAGAVLCFLRAVECHEAAPAHPQALSTKGRGAEWAWQQAALLCVAAGTLTKWTAPAFFYLTAIPFLLWRRRIGLLWGRAHFTAVGVAALPCAAWSAAVACRVGWAPLLDTVRQEALQHLSPFHHARPYPWAEVATFPSLFLAANLPLCVAAVPTLSRRFGRLWDERGRRLWQLLHCWVWPNLAFWSAVPGHHFRHGLPLQPGLVGLAAMACLGWMTGRLRWPLPRLRPGWALAALVAAWLGVKLVFVHAVVPGRDVGRSPRARAEQLAALVPPDETLYLCGLKDEGILFYYGRPARRVDRLENLSALPRPVYCALTEAEWEERPALVVLRLTDEQGAPIVLARLAP
jgi:4-amino-4-deoxy-L-arabinose transferase-like glycosyltransferase